MGDGTDLARQRVFGHRNQSDVGYLPLFTYGSRGMSTYLDSISVYCAYACMPCAYIIYNLILSLHLCFVSSIYVELF